MLLPVGTRYELVRKLAVGGMAEVHLARATAPGGLQTLVALKRIRPELPDSEYVPMFLDEVRLAERLRHPNLTYVLDTSAAIDHRYYVMEYLEGCDARQLCMRASELGRRLPFELSLPIVIGVAAGLHHAHSCVGDDGRPLGIVHRDVSPSNLFVTHDGRVKVIDFGIALYSEKRSETRVGIVKGKIRYLAPEQFRFMGVDRRTDVFALSIVLWQLTVGQRPYDSDNDYAVLKAICEQDAPRPSAACPGYPPELEAIALKGLRRDPAERWQSADELRRALVAFVEERGIRRSTGDVAEQMRHWTASAHVGARYRFDPREAAGESARTDLRVGGGYGEATYVDPVFERTG
jgi:serine/threonine-protein kinase